MTAQCPTCKGRGEVPEAKVCALPNCGRQFVWQDEGRDRRHPRVDAIYCSRSCKHAAAMRTYRSRKAA